MIPGIRGFPNEDSSRKLNMHTLEMRGVRSRVIDIIGTENGDELRGRK